MSTAGRRWQRGALCLRRGRWVLRLRVDVADPDSGCLHRREKSIEVGHASSLRSRSAARVAADAIADAATGRRLAPGVPVSAARYLATYDRDRLSILRPSTQRTARTLIRTRIAPALRGCRLDQIDGARLQQLVAEWNSAGLAPATVRACVRRLLAILRAARADGHRIGELDPKSIRYPSTRAPSDSPKILEPHELRRLIDHAPPPWLFAFALQGVLGLRAGELLGLRVDDFDQAASTVRIQRAAVAGRLAQLKTRGSAATLPLPAALLDRLRQHLAAEGIASGLLFRTATGRPVDRSWYARQLRRCLAAAGLPSVGTHGLRRSAASALLAAGVAPQVVRDVLRHASLAQTNTYSRSISSDLRGAADAMGALLEGCAP